MIKIKKALCYLLAVVCIILPLSACAQGESDDKVAGISRSASVLEIENGDSVEWGEFYYYLQYVRSSLEYYGTIDWEESFALSDGTEKTYNEYAIEIAIENAKGMRAVENVFSEMGIALDEERYEQNKAELMESYGIEDEEGYGELLADYYMTEDLYKRLYNSNVMYEQIFTELYGEDGSLCPDDEIDAYVESNSIVRVKNLLIKTIDENGDALSEEEIEEIKTQSDDLYQQLSAYSGDELIEKFDEFIDEYNEDPGMDYYPDGYTYAPGTMVTAFEDAAAALEIGEISEPIESDYGYHIILRLPVERDAEIYGTGYTIEYTVSDERVSSIISEAGDSITYTETDLLASIVPSEIFALADEESAQDAADADSTDSVDTDGAVDTQEPEEDVQDPQETSEETGEAQETDESEDSQETDDAQETEE